MTDPSTQVIVRIPSNKRLVCTKWGKNPRLEVVEAPLDVRVVSGTILVSVKAACLSALDVQLCRGSLKRKVPTRPPHGLGYDFAGVVSHVASPQGKFKCGDAVFGCLPLSEPGSVSDNILVNEAWCALKPEELSFSVASALGWNSLLSSAVLSDLKVTLDDRLLILGGATSTGHLLIQLAKELFEVEWVATTSTHDNRAFCEDCGADEVFDFQASKSSHWAKPFLKTHSYDVILDCVDDPLGFGLMRRGGRKSTLLTGEKPPALFSFACTRPLPALPQPDGEVLERIGILAFLGKVNPKLVSSTITQVTRFFDDSTRLLVIEFA